MRAQEVSHHKVRKRSVQRQPATNHLFRTTDNGQCDLETWRHALARRTRLVAPKWPLGGSSPAIQIHFEKGRVDIVAAPRVVSLSSARNGQKRGKQANTRENSGTRSVRHATIILRNVQMFACHQTPNKVGFDLRHPQSFRCGSNLEVVESSLMDLVFGKDDDEEDWLNGFIRRKNVNADAVERG
ncbi:hypothetical protein FI667_g9867, partial [Globisporangium splendens]